MTPLRQRMLEELQRRNYNTDTIRGYILAVEQFAPLLPQVPGADGRRGESAGDFSCICGEKKKLAVGTIALRIGALRFLYKKTLKRRDLDFDDLRLAEESRRSCR